MLTVADTAYLVAQIRADESKRPEGERLFEDPFAVIFASAGAHAAEATARMMALPNLVSFVRLRTRFIDDAVRAARKSGVAQVVLLGAGFDARALRQPELAGAGVYEVDFDVQLRTKRQLLEAAKVAPRANHEYVASDFNAPDYEAALARSLAAAGYREGEPTLFILEGVVAYISAATLDRTLRVAARLGGPTSRIVFEYAPMAFDADPAEARALRAGYTRFETVACDVLWRTYLHGEPPPNIEILHLGTATV